MAKGITVSKGETVGSLRAYFFIVAVVGGFLNLFTLLRMSLDIGTVLSLAGVCVAVAYLYLGISLKTLIAQAPERAQQIVLASGALMVVALLINLALGYMPGVLQGVVGLLIVWYLVANLRRLAAEAAAVPLPPQPEALHEAAPDQPGIL